ncbi:NAD(P)-dependent oxidoreductase [Rhodococcus sp. CH91]|uniref:NAD(P)-dependent oxidoreductase n=1 Tax=Rhodococcus sp. CH91 TaxID=2910256 RepID=UPI001F4A9DEB|nr:NAD(P)-dependent oxidoreductase [Rhodococcus sp. CH91]
MEIGFLGLGTMGTPMARNMARVGNTVLVWNRSPGKAGSVVEYGAREVVSPTEALHVPVSCSALADDHAFAGTVLSSDALAAMQPGSVHVNLATVSPEMATHAAEALAGIGVRYVASPVFGRAEVAEAGNLTVLAAGDPDAVDEVAPLLEVIGRRTWRIGEDPRQANIMKVLGNYLIANALQAIAEATTIAEKVGGSPELLMDIMNDSLFPGVVYEGYGRMISRRTYEPTGFGLALGLKDVRLARAQARGADVTLPFGSVLEDVFVDALAHGQGRQDWSAITEATRRRAGLAENGST